MTETGLPISQLQEIRSVHKGVMTVCSGDDDDDDDEIVEVACILVSIALVSGEVTMTCGLKLSTLDAIFFA